MVTNSPSDYPLAPVQFSRLARRGIMLGLSLPQLIVLGIAVLTVVFSLYTADGMGLAWTAPSTPPPATPPSPGPGESSPARQRRQDPPPPPSSAPAGKE